MSTKQNKKLYRVRVDTILLVLADNEGEAKKETLSEYLFEHMKENNENCRVVCEITSMGQIPPGWIDRVPYGNHLSRLVEGITAGEFILRRLFNSRNR